jgi:PKD repeat protein
MKLFRQLIFLLYLIPSWGFASVWYIDDDISNSGDGTSWADAFKTIQEGVDAASNNDEIWLKLGTYSLSSRIQVNKAVAIYGGFSGLETDRNQRDWYSNTTTISGNNSVRIFYISADATIDGLTLSNGRATNHGGAIYNDNASPNISHCKLLNNNAGTGGGAIYNQNANPIITNCSFINNNASNGGGIYNQASSPTITNSSFAKNSGGIYNDSQSSPNITNTIIWNNSTSITNETGATPVVSYSNIQNGGYTENGNMDLDPLFNSDLQLQAGSPVINQANSVPSTDIDGNPRLQNEGDIGAYEYYESGVLRFSRLDSNSFNESNNSPITIEVKRLSGNSGEISVDYASKEGSAGNKDYTPVSGTLTWGDGDNNSKTFTIQINEDEISEANESFSLTLQNATGSAVAASSPILLQIIDNDLQAKFTITSQNDAAPLTVKLDASKSIAGTNLIENYEWSVNNEASFFGNPAPYTFKEHGTYKVKLIVKNNKGGTSELTKTLKVKARPIAQIKVDPPKEKWQGFPLNVQLDGNKSNDPDGSIVKYEWLVNGNSINGQKASATVNSIKDVIKLTVTDNDGLTASVNYTTLPTACIKDVTPKKGEPGLKVSLDGSCSIDDDGRIVKYDWYASNGQTVSSSSPYANMTFKKSGTYKISLEVTDNDGAKSNNKTKTAEILIGNSYTITINKEGTGNGIITDKELENDQELPTDMGINCGDDCSEKYIETTKVNLFAKADAGSLFKGWQATNCHSTGSCRFEITQDETVTAKFDTCQYTVEQENNPHSYEAKGYSLKVTTNKGCQWNAVNDENKKWVDIRSTPKHSTGGIVNYWVETNSDEFAREAVLKIAGKEVTVTQLGHYKVEGFNLSSSKGNVPLTVTVTAINTLDPFGNSLSDGNYKWKISDGQTATGKTANIKFDTCSEKAYTITLNIENNGKVYGSAKKDIEVNCLPTAKFSYRIMFGQPIKVKLDASESMDEDGDISKYEWYVDKSNETSGENANLSFKEGSYNIELQVTDNRGETNIVSQTIEIVKPYNETARVSPQVIAAGISPSQINLDTDDRYDVVAIVRRGVNPIHTVRFQDADMSSNDNINLADIGIKMSRAGILPNGDEVYKVSYAYDRSIGNTTISTTWGSKPGQFNIEAIDNLQQYSHIYPYLMVGNYPSQTVNKQSASSINYDNTRRNDPQVIMAGYSPAKLDFGDTEFDVIAIVRPGKLPIKRVIAKSNATGEDVFHKIMHYIGELDNGDQVYKITLTYPRGAFGAGTAISYKDLFGPASTQFGIEAVDDNEQGSHAFPDIKFGNYPEYKINK